MTLPTLDCAGCRKCCQGGNSAALRPEMGDDPSAYFTRPGPNGERVLARGANGDCVYLGPDGCRIHDRKPYECRAFDCRAYFSQVETDEEAFDARLRGPGREVLMEGRARVRRWRGTQAAAQG